MEPRGWAGTPKELILRPSTWQVLRPAYDKGPCAEAPAPKGPGGRDLSQGTDPWLLPEKSKVPRVVGRDRCVGVRRPRLGWVLGRWEALSSVALSP